MEAVWRGAKKKTELKEVLLDGGVLEGPRGVEEPKERGTLKSGPRVLAGGGLV